MGPCNYRKQDDHCVCEPTYYWLSSCLQVLLALKFFISVGSYYLFHLAGKPKLGSDSCLHSKFLNLL